MHWEHSQRCRLGAQAVWVPTYEDEHWNLVGDAPQLCGLGDIRAWRNVRILQETGWRPLQLQKVRQGLHNRLADVTSTGQLATHFDMPEAAPALLWANIC